MERTLTSGGRNQTLGRGEGMQDRLALDQRADRILDIRVRLEQVLAGAQRALAAVEITVELNSRGCSITPSRASRSVISDVPVFLGMRTIVSSGYCTGTLDRALQPQDAKISVPAIMQPKVSAPLNMPSMPPRGGRMRWGGGGGATGFRASAGLFGERRAWAAGSTGATLGEAAEVVSRLPNMPYLGKEEPRRGMPGPSQAALYH